MNKVARRELVTPMMEMTLMILMLMEVMMVMVEMVEMVDVTTQKSTHQKFQLQNFSFFKTLE